MYKLNCWEKIIDGEVTPSPMEEVAPDEHNQNKYKYETAITMLGGSTKNGYSRLWKSILHQFNLSVEDIPSYFQMESQRPKIENLLLQHDRFLLQLSTTNDSITTTDIDSVVEHSINEREILKIHSDTSEEVALIETSHAGNSIHGVRLRVHTKRFWI